MSVAVVVSVVREQLYCVYQIFRGISVARGDDVPCPTG